MPLVNRANWVKKCLCIAYTKKFRYLFLLIIIVLEIWQVFFLFLLLQGHLKILGQCTFRPCGVAFFLLSLFVVFFCNYADILGIFFFSLSRIIGSQGTHSVEPLSIKIFVFTTALTWSQLEILNIFLSPASPGSLNFVSFLTLASLVVEHSLSLLSRWSFRILSNSHTWRQDILWNFCASFRLAGLTIGHLHDLAPWRGCVLRSSRVAFPSWRCVGVSYWPRRWVKTYDTCNTQHTQWGSCALCHCIKFNGCRIGLQPSSIHRMTGWVAIPFGLWCTSMCAQAPFNVQLHLGSVCLE